MLSPSAYMMHPVLVAFRIDGDRCLLGSSRPQPCMGVLVFCPASLLAACRATPFTLSRSNVRLGGEPLPCELRDSQAATQRVVCCWLSAVIRKIGGLRSHILTGFSSSLLVRAAWKALIAGRIASRKAVTARHHLAKAALCCHEWREAQFRPCRSLSTRLLGPLKDVLHTCCAGLNDAPCADGAR